jgi:L-ascorbate metabolism protein UlaG (beta-lactamase superfamily)
MRAPRIGAAFAMTVALMSVAGRGAAAQRGTRESNGHSATAVRLTYLGTAGWEISDGRTVVLVDPYLTRLPRSAFGSWVETRDGIPLAMLGDRPVAPDTAAIDARVQRADYVLVGHSHYDHLLDVPYIARRTGASIVGTPSTRNVAAAHGLPRRAAHHGARRGGLRFRPFLVARDPKPPQRSQ